MSNKFFSRPAKGGADEEEGDKFAFDVIGPQNVEVKHDNPEAGVESQDSLETPEKEAQRLAECQTIIEEPDLDNPEDAAKIYQIMLENLDQDVATSMAAMNLVRGNRSINEPDQIGTEVDLRETEK